MTEARAKPFARRIAAAAVAVLLVVALATLSQIPFSVDTSDSGVLRLSWRIRSANREQCRVPDPGEMANIPIHMRPTRICDTENIPFTLRVDIDSRRVVERLVEAAGSRADRPLYVYEDIRVPPGTHDLDVRFFSDREDTTDVSGSVPNALRFTQAVTFASRQVVLMTYDEGMSRLVIR